MRIFFLFFVFCILTCNSRGVEPSHTGSLEGGFWNRHSREPDNDAALRALSSLARDIVCGGSDEFFSKRVLLENALVKKMQEFNGKSLKVSFPVTDIVGPFNGVYTLSLGPPDDLFASYSMNYYRLRLTDEMLLKFKNTSKLVCSGSVVVHYGDAWNRALISKNAVQPIDNVVPRANEMLVGWVLGSENSAGIELKNFKCELVH